MKIIVAVDSDWGIGYEGKLLQSIPEDMKFFKEKTMGNIVVMGRETFESLPKKKPLKNRINIVLTRKETFKEDGLIICKSIEEALEELKKYESDKIFIIGGEAIYKQFLPYCEEVYVTKMNHKYVADKYFPNLDQDPNWILKECQEREHENIKYSFNLYRKRV